MKEKPARAFDKRSIPERINGNGSMEFPAKVPSTYDRFSKRSEGKSVRDEVNERIGCTSKFGKCLKNDNDMGNNVVKEGVSVCLTAWKTAEFIEQCLDSIERQTYFKDFNDYEILLGIDGCQETLGKVKSIMGKYRNLRVFMMESNCGTYVTCNTMMSMAKYDWFLRFDTDDLMMPEMIETMFAKKGGASLVTITVQNFFLIDSHHRKTCKAHGIHLVSAELFRKVNGYKAWTCSADSDFLSRCKKFGKSITLSETLMMRRVQPNSLTISKETAFGNPIRSKYRRIIETTDYSKASNCINESIVTGSCDEISRCDAEFALDKKFPDNSVIVSFTTYPKREKYVPVMVESILAQDLEPDAVICWLSEDEYPCGTMPETLKSYADNGVISVRYLKGNSFGYKRYESVFEFHNCINILVDDDIVYGKTHISELVESAIKNPECVACFYSDSVSYSNGKIVHGSLKTEASFETDLLSGMSCFPPSVCDRLLWSRKYDFERCHVAKSDDSWVKACLIKSGVKTIGLHDRLGSSPWVTVEGSQEVSMLSENKVIVNGVTKKAMDFMKSSVFLGCDLPNAIGISYSEVKKFCGSEFEDLLMLSRANFGTFIVQKDASGEKKTADSRKDTARKTSLPGIMAYQSI